MHNIVGYDIDYTNLDKNDYLRKYREYLLAKNITNRKNSFIANGLPIKLNHCDTDIAVNVSGGADSALLLYILARYISEQRLKIKVHPICVVRRWETTEYLEKAKDRVVNYVKKLFPNVIQDIIWGFLPTAYDHTPIGNIVFADKFETDRYKTKIGKCFSDVYFFHSFNSWIARRYNIKQIYSGTTINPDSFDHKDRPKFRDVSEINDTKLSYKWEDANWKSDAEYHVKTFDAFGMIQKNWVTAQYTNYNIEDLFSITHSCEEERNGCGECFHCHERSWSIDNKDIYLDKNLKLLYHSKKEKLCHLITKPVTRLMNFSKLKKVGNI
jgi:hypothetical protein